MPSRTPRWPSIGLNSWSCSTRRSSVSFSSSSSLWLARDLEPGDLDHQLFALRQELVERRIDRANRHRLAVHRLEHAVEVVPLQRQQLVRAPPGDPPRCPPGSSAGRSECAPRRRTCARCGTGRCRARRRHRQAPPGRAGRRWRGRPCGGTCRTRSRICMNRR